MKNSAIAAILSLITLLLFSGFDFFNSLVGMPNFLWTLPLYIFFRVSVFYFSKIFIEKLTVPFKIGVILLNVAFCFLLLYTGFQIWKLNSGNIFTETQQVFQFNAKNIWFWVVFQSYLLLFFFSAFKHLVTIDQK